MDATAMDNSVMVLSDREDGLRSAVQSDSGRLYGIAFSILRDQAEAEDAVQGTWIKAWRGWNWSRHGAPPAPWLTRVCVNGCLNRRRGIVVRLRTLRGVAQSEATVSAAAPAVGHIDLARAYQTLSLRQRAAVALHYYHGFSVDECAGLMNCRPGTVRSHLARALTRLREEMNGD